MRANNHIVNRNSYQDLSSFKIRQPINEQSFINNQKYTTKYCIKQQPYHYNRSIQHEQENLFSSFYDKYPHRNHATYQSKQNSRQLSYNSRGSNATRNSIKMTDYIALQAKNLIQNRDKYKYDGQNHMRSSSMQCYPNSFKVSRGQPERPYKYLNDVQQSNQPTQIPSFGIQCRTTISGGYPIDKSHSVSKYPIKSYKLEYSSISRHLQNRNIKTQIDERIERLRASSTSTRHKQRVSTLKQIDENRLQNMDKINIKIKNILTTLQKEQDHYKKRFVQNSGNRVKTESSALKQNRNYMMTEQDQQTLLSKYTQNNTYQQQNSCFDNSAQNVSNLQYNNNYQDSSIISHTGFNKLCDNNISSYYYYQDESAMMKSSQSPFKSSPQRSFKKYSVQKDKDYSISKYSKGQAEISKVKKYNQSLKPYVKENESNSSRKVNTKYQKMDGSFLKNIPECETQIIESKAFQLSNNAFTQQYHTFDSKKSERINKRCLQLKYQRQRNELNLNRDQQNYKTPELHQLQNCYYPYNIDSRRNNVKQEQMDKQIDRIGQYVKKNKVQQIKCNQIQQISNNNKRNHSIYFKIDDKQKYLKSSTRNNKSPEQVNNYKYQQFPTLQTKLKQLKQQKLYNQKNQNILTNKYQNNQYLQTFNIRNKNGQNNIYELKKQQYIYSDSIKQTPRIKSIQQNQYKNVQIKNNRQYTRNNKVKTEYDQKLDQKLHQYQKRLLKYQKQMSASKIIQSHRNQSHNKSLNSKRQKQNQHSLQIINYSKQNVSNSMISQFKTQQQQVSKNHLANMCQKNVQKLLSDVKRQRNSKRQNNSNNVSKQFYQTDFQYKKNKNLYQQTYSRLESMPPKYPPHQSHRFGKQDHQKFIQELKKDRQQVYQLSQRKSRFKNCISVDNPRTQGSNQRSESQNSRISSTTIVKGKNIDEEISKIQKKMEQYQLMKKQLHLQSQQNTQRQIKKEETKEFKIDSSQNKKVQAISKSPKKEKNVRFNDQLNNHINQKTQKSNNDWLKIVEQKNSYVKIRSSILKQNKSNQIKNYLDQEIQKVSNRSKSIGQINDVALTKSRHTLNKQNILPPTTTTIDSPKYSNGSKKIVLGLAQNLVLNSLDQQQNIDKEIKGKQNDIKTPKLLRNLKGKLNDVSIVKKKAQKRGFRSQFINDLHQDNQILSSNKKADLQTENDDITNSTSRYSPQNRQILIQILCLIEKQILIDEQFRNQKKMFNAMTKKDKWTILMTEYIKQAPQDKNILLSQIVQIFTLHEEQSNPFYSTRGVDFSLGSLVSTYIKCKNNWYSIIKQISDISHEKLTSCGLSAKCLDIERKGFIQVDDLTRFMNMQLNKYYRKRDLWLVWQRISSANSTLISSHSAQKLKFVDFIKGLGLKSQFM